MSTLKDIVKAAHAGTNLFVTGPHYDWIETPEEEQIYSPEALEHVVKVLGRGYKHERSGRISPSAMGECARRVLLGYAGAPQDGFDETSVHMMDNGTWSHLKWQAEGITAGWMQAGEAWVHDPGLRTGGSMDGLLTDDSLFELKTAAPNVYSRIVGDLRAPKYENLLQVHTYFLLADIDVASVVYEDRAFGNFHEFRVSRSAKLEREVLRRLNSYNGLINDDGLPPQLADCELRMGQTFKRCPFRSICHIPTTLSEAQALPHST